MRLTIRVATAIRSRKLILPGQRVLVALSGGPDSVALLNCLLEISKKRDLPLKLLAAHLNHGLRGKDAATDEKFCERLCARKDVRLISAYADTPKLAAQLKRSKEETARLARRAFLAAVAAAEQCDRVAVAHHADDRIETVLYRLCRGTGLAGLQGIGWTGPLGIEKAAEILPALKWRGGEKYPLHPRDSAALVVRPMLGCSRAEIMAYLKAKRQKYCTDETNFDTNIPRNALRNMVLPMLAEKVHPGAHGALWRLAEEAEVQAEKREWRREWLTAFAAVQQRGELLLPAPRLGSAPAIDEVRDALQVLASIWNLSGSFTHRHAEALQRLFISEHGGKEVHLPEGMLGERRGRTVVIRRGETE